VSTPVTKREQSDAALASSLRVSVTRLGRRLRNERDPADDLSVHHLAVLGTLGRNGAMSIGDLAAAEKVQPPSMTRTVNALVERGLIRRAARPDDKRIVVVDLTEDARLVLEVSRRRKEAWLNQRLAELTPAERQNLRDAAPILDRISHA
jgi:DNA-binding MarR family transcriptional regulator